MARSKPMNYGLPFQRAVIKFMMDDGSFRMKAVEHLKSSDFSGELSWFFETIRTNYSDLKTPPTKENLVADISKHKIDKQLNYYRELDEILAAHVTPERIIAEMTGFIRANMFIDSYSEAAPLYNSGSNDKAYAHVADAMAKLNAVNFGQQTRQEFGNGREISLSMAEDARNAIKTGIHAIDAAMGGMLPGSWTTFLGASNAGKSMLMPMLALQSALQGKRTLVTVHEDEEKPTKIRYLSCFSGIAFNKIAYGFHTLEPSELARFDEADALLNKYVSIKFMYTSDATVEKVMDHARAVMREWPFDLFLCDYGQCLTTRDAKKTDSIRHIHEHVYHLLKQLCLELDIPGAGGAQLNRVGVGKNMSGADWIRGVDVSESFGIYQKASNFITINRSSDDVRNNRVVFLLDKCRNGKTQVAVSCESNYETCRVYNPEPGRQKDVSKLIDLGPAEREDAEKDRPDPESKAPEKTKDDKQVGNPKVQQSRA